MWKHRGFLYLAILLASCGDLDSVPVRPGATRWVEDDIKSHRWIRSGICREFERQNSKWDPEPADQTTVKRIECQEVYAKYLPIELLPLDPKPSK